MPENRSPASTSQRLRISDNRRFLVHEDGTPFFYLGDTAWELFHRLNREEADRYLEHRAAGGYTVIQAVVLAELDGLNDPNPYGHTPLKAHDPAQPDEAYFEHVDYIVHKAASLGLRIGMLPTWGDKWHARPGRPAIFTPENAHAYGRFLGQRYAEKPIIWILGGDRQIETARQLDILRQMARGLREGDEGRHLITFHPRGGGSSAQWLHQEEWLDFNMRQNGHVLEFDGRYDQTRRDYDREDPLKPVIDGEPIYEDHPVAFKPDEFGHSTAADVRRPLYWNLFSGAFGHTYGHHSVWQMYAPGRNPINRPLMYWFDAIDQPGAGQMQHGRRLMESRPFLSRVPDDELIVPAEAASSVPGAGSRRFVATRDDRGSYAMVYAPIGRTFSMRLDRLAGEKIKAWWYDPRTGAASASGEFAASGSQDFTPPQKGELLDWVLVLDDAAAGYSPPGQS